MTATYDLSSVTDLNRARFHTGDTNVSAARWTDEEITYAVSAAGSWQGAVILLLTSLHAKLAGTPDYQADWLTESPSKAAASLEKLIKAKRRELGVSGVSASATHQWRPDTGQTEAPYSAIYPAYTGYSTTAGSSGGSGGGSGSVTSVGVTVPAGLFTATGSPVTSDGTIAISLISQSANQVFAAPNGASGTPAFRALVAADMPDLSGIYAVSAHNHSGVYAPVSHAHAAGDVTSGTFDTARIPDLSGTYAAAGHNHAGVYAPVSHAHAASDVTSGTFDNARVNWAAPSALGSTTPAQVTATDVVVTGEVRRATGNLAVRSVDANVLLYASDTLVGGYTSTARIDYVPVTVSVANTGTDNVTTLLTLTRNTSDLVAPGFGAGLLCRLEDAGGTLQDVGGLKFVLTGVTAGSVSSIATIGIVSAGTPYTALALRYSSGTTTLETSGTCVISPSGFQVAKFVTSQIEHLKPLKAYIDSSTLNTVVESELMNLTGSGTKATGFGVSKQFQLKCETTASTSAARRSVLWSNGTYATRQADVVWYANDYGGEREALRLRANGTAAAIGFLGATPQARPAAYTQTYSTADRTLSAYTADAESSAYTGIDNAQGGAVYAQLADLNALRTAYENLRAFVEDLAQGWNSVVDDLQGYGLLQ